MLLFQLLVEGGDIEDEEDRGEGGTLRVRRVGNASGSGW
jgi:hypothetical protein